MTDVALGSILLGRWVTGCPRFWIGLGNLESKILADTLASQAIHQPIYVCGLARSGSTLLLEILVAHTGTASHRYQDFPFIFTPYWWNTVLKLVPFQDRRLRERPHADGMMVNAASPEAMEEMLWNAFFPNLHSLTSSQMMDAATANPAFERFYREHVQKLLLVRKASRYIAKGNYNLTRMCYLLKLFPDARFVVPVREPAAHIASLMRQHRHFCDAGHRNPRIVQHMGATGHFEFGLDRRPIHTGNQLAIDAIISAWNAGEEVRGWALYWNMLHDAVLQQFNADQTLRDAVLWVPFEKLCDAPRDTIARIVEHCRLTPEAAVTDRYAAAIRRPGYYDPGFSVCERETIAGITQATAQALGY